MNTPALTIFRFPDLSGWEWDLVAPVVQGLAERHPVEFVEVTAEQRGSLRRGGKGGVYWVLARDWRKALRFLSPAAPAKVFASVFEMGMRRRSLPTLFFKQYASSVPACVRLLTYSPLNLRFFREMDGLGEERIFPMSLAVPSLSPPTSPSGRTVIGTFAPFIADSNLHYLLNVAHYTARRNPEVMFRIIGSGPLYPHLSTIVAELGLEHHVQIVDQGSIREIAPMDIFLYVPLRNDHFGPLLYAAAAGLPVLTNEVPGIEEFISDGSDGFILPVNETKPMGELLLRLVDSQPLRQLLGAKFQTGMRQKCAVENLVRQSEGALFNASMHREGESGTRRQAVAS